MGVFMTRTLRQWRHERLLTLRALADRAGLAHGTVWGVETGERVPTIGTVERLSETLGVAPSEVAELARALEARGAGLNNRAA